MSDGLHQLFAESSVDDLLHKPQPAVATAAMCLAPSLSAPQLLQLTHAALEHAVRAVRAVDTLPSATAHAQHQSLQTVRDLWAPALAMNVTDACLTAAAAPGLATKEIGQAQGFFNQQAVVQVSVQLQPDQYNSALCEPTLELHQSSGQRGGGQQTGLDAIVSHVIELAVSGCRADAVLDKLLQASNPGVQHALDRYGKSQHNADTELVCICAASDAPGLYGK